MADSYLQYGIDGVIRIAAETLETLKNNLQSELQDQTQLDIVYLEVCCMSGSVFDSLLQITWYLH